MSVSPASRDEIVEPDRGLDHQCEPAAPHGGDRGRDARPGRATRRTMPTCGAWPVWRTTSTPRRPRATSRATAPARRSGSPSSVCRPTSSTRSRPTTRHRRRGRDALRRRADRRRPDHRPDHGSHPRASRPSLLQVKLSSVRKRLREGAFARGVDRASIVRCEELGLDLEEFLAIALAAMQGIAADLGLAGE